MQKNKKYKNKYVREIQNLYMWEMEKVRNESA